MFMIFDDLLADHVMFKVSTGLNFDLNEDTDKRETTKL